MSGKGGGYYARIMGTFWRHPRTSSLPMAARGLWVSLLSWSADQRSDGTVPAHALGMVCGGRIDARALSALIESGLLERTGETYTLRDWAQHNITREEHDASKDEIRKRVAKHRQRAAVTPDVTRYTHPGNAVRIEQEQEQEQEQEHSRSSEREIRARAPEAREPSVTERAEKARATIASAYRSRGLAVPRQVASLASTTETAATLAGLPAEALPSILERFFNDHAMKAKGYPVSFLLTNPNQWAIDGISRDDGSPRERPAETVIPDWMRGGAA